MVRRFRNIHGDDVPDGPEEVRSRNVVKERRRNEKIRENEGLIEGIPEAKRRLTTAVEVMDDLWRRLEQKKMEMRQLGPSLMGQRRSRQILMEIEEIDGKYRRLCKEIDADIAGLGWFRRSFNIFPDTLKEKQEEVAKLRQKLQELGEESGQNREGDVALLKSEITGLEEEIRRKKDEVDQYSRDLEHREYIKKSPYSGVEGWND